MVTVAPNAVVLFADIGCPWSHLAVHRWRDARARLGLQREVFLEVRPFPLELFNERPTPKRVLDAEIPLVGALAPEAGWQIWQRELFEYPVTTLPALEAVEAAKDQGREAAEELDVSLRRAFFGQSRNISMRHEILDIARGCRGVAADELARALDDGRSRRRLMDSFEDAQNASVKGSPHFFLPDGTDLHNPGIEMHWEGPHGMSFPVVDSDDPTVYEEMFDRVARTKR